MKDYAPSRSPCPIGRASRLLGDRWVILILREAFLGVDRFDAFVDRLEINRAALTSRLAWLVEAGLLVREPADARRGRYVLTESGRALGPTYVSMGEWATKWLPQSPIIEGSEPATPLTRQITE
jgi:DNA-binding HxlR family transcriptional regulator